MATKSVATRVAEATAKISEEARSLDRRRQTQIANQVEIIDRLMAGATYDDVMDHLQQRLVSTQMELADAEAEISRLRAEQSGD